MRTTAPIRPATESIPIAPPAHVRRLGVCGLVWALGYVPIHVYWAMGGRSAWIGITDPDPDWRVANWGACVVLLGAGLTCLALTEPWGASMPAGLRRGAAWIGGVIGLAHWVLFSLVGVLHLAGVLDNPTGEQTAAQLTHFTWLNLAVFEPWFAIMGLLLIAAARHTVPERPVAAAGGDRRAAVLRRSGSVLAVTGIAVVVLGVMFFEPWLFAGAGPVVFCAGLALCAVPALRTPGRRV